MSIRRRVTWPRRRPSVPQPTPSQPTPSPDSPAELVLVPVEAKTRRWLRVPTLSRPSGGWGAPTTVLTAGAAVAVIVALPLVGGGPLPGSAVNALAGDLSTTEDDGTASRSVVSVTGIVGPATEDQVDDPFGTAPDALPAVGSPATGDPSAFASNGIPDVTLRAYQAAEAALAIADPTCRLDWALLAGIGRVESNHGRYGGAAVTGSGLSVPSILGVRLDGSVPDTIVIRDTDAGTLDGDQVYDRAVGPMQFLPGSWELFGTDGDGDGSRNPQDIDDASLAAAAYLCSGPDDLSARPGASAAVRRYNNSGEYVNLVLGLADAYRRQTTPPVIPVVAAVGDVPVRPLPPSAPAAPPTGIGVNPGTPGTSPTGVDPTQVGPVVPSRTVSPGTTSTPPATTSPTTQPSVTKTTRSRPLPPRVPGTSGTASPTDPATTAPSTTDPATTDPTPTDPATTDPTPTDPPTEPSPTGPTPDPTTPDPTPDPPAPDPTTPAAALTTADACATDSPTGGPTPCAPVPPG